MDHSNQSGNHSGLPDPRTAPEYFIRRGENVFTPLVPLDRLPAWVTVGGISRVFSCSEIARCDGKALPSQDCGEEYSIRVGYDLSVQLASPDAEANYDPAGCPQPNAIHDPIPSVEPDEIQHRYQPITPGVLGGKKYCTHWIRTGECDFIQQGCMYLHVIPTPEGLRELGFRAYPRWFREMPYEDQAAISQQGVGLGRRRGPFKRTRNTRGVPHEGPAQSQIKIRGNAASTRRRPYPYSLEKSVRHPEQDNRPSSQPASTVREIEGDTYYGATRADQFQSNANDHEAQFHNGGNTPGVGRQFQSQRKQEYQSEQRTTSSSSSSIAPNGYVPTPRPYNDSDLSSGSNRSRGQDNRRSSLAARETQQRSYPKSKEQEPVDHDPASPQNFYVAPSAQRGHPPSHNNVYGGQVKGGYRARGVDSASRSPTYTGRAPGSRDQNVGRHAPSPPGPQNSTSHKTEARRARRKWKKNNGSGREKGLRDMPRLQYPPQPNGEHVEPALFSCDHRDGHGNGNEEEEELLIQFSDC